MNKFDEAYNIFIEHYGEDRVDKEIHSDNAVDVIIWFPEIEVTNEYNLSTKVYDLYVYIPMNMDGDFAGVFKVKRTTFQESHILHKYIHSHSRPLNLNLDLSYKYSMCLGTGPILKTITTLSIKYDAEMLKLFCYELDKYLETESVAGGPYIYIRTLTNNIGNIYNNTINLKYALNFNEPDCIADTILKPFVEYLINNKCLKFNYFNGAFGIAETKNKLIIHISNFFINYINEINNANSNKISLKYLIDNYILVKVILKDNVFRFYGRFNTNNLKNIADLEGKTILTFKKQPIKLKIIDGEKKDKYLLVLKSNIINTILSRILYAVNSLY